MELLGITIGAAPDRSRTINEINSVLRTIKPEDLKKVTLKLDIDKTALDSVNDFNESLKRLSNQLKKVNQDIKQTFSGANFSKVAKETEQVTKETQKLTKETEHLTQKQTQQAQKSQENYRNQARQLSELEKLTTRINKKGETSITEHRRSKDGIYTGKVQDGYLTQLTENRNASSKLLKQQQDINKMIDDLQAKGIADPKRLSQFRSQSVSNDIRELERLTQAIRIYRSELERTDRVERARAGLRHNIQSTIYKYGEDQRLMQMLGKVDTADLKGLDAMKLKHREIREELQKINQLYAAQRRFVRNTKQLRMNIHSMPYDLDKQISNLRGELFSIDPKSEKNLSDRINRIMTELDMVKDKAYDADQGLARFVRQTASAILRVPIYAATIAALYTPMRAFNDAIRQTIELDSQLTVLERVSNGAIDVNKALEESIGISERLGNVIGEVNEGLIAFSRQGYRGDDLTKITEVATLMSNVSDLSVEETSGSITAAMKGFNIEADKSIHIVNALNEVDNNYAVTTRQLAESIQRAAGTSSVYGSTLERNIGYTTAIAEVTRESGRIIGNSLKSIMSRISSVPEAIEELGAIGINVKDSSGEMKEFDSILDELGAKWNSLSKEQQQNIGLAIAGRYQLSRFTLRAA